MTPTLTIEGTRAGLLEKLDLLEGQDRLRRQQAALLETQKRFAALLETQAQARRERKTREQAQQQASQSPKATL